MGQKKYILRNNSWNIPKFDFKNKKKGHIDVEIPENQQTSTLSHYTSYDFTLYVN